MKLTVSTPLSLVVDAQEVVQLRAEDASGSFGILPGHADFLTVLTACVLSWRSPRGDQHYLAVRGGVLEVSAGQNVAVATREAIGGDHLQELESRVVAQFRHQDEEERIARTDAQKLYIAAIRQICRLIRAERDPAAVGAPTLRPLGHGEQT